MGINHEEDKEEEEEEEDDKEEEEDKEDPPKLHVEESDFIPSRVLLGREGILKFLMLVSSWI